eukprot:TRINITY_DN55296_c0_g1_i5.p1 TRINITY_DN55296_c0_g1~~TRINITY_DN55296_c0_g1_i5.p1  ORF type:complete len:376 (+),score=63.87 TRINITY_DN55296_c0_g1_i5:2-1129(+)
MTTKSKFNLAGIKAGFQRTKQKVLTKFGKSEKTVDIQFDQDVERFKATLKALENTQKHCKEFLKSLRSLCIAENGLAEDMSASFESHSSVYDAANKNKTIIAELDHARTQLEEKMREDFLEPFSEYLSQYGSIKSRIDERNRRLVDMDRYRHDYQKASEKGDAGKAQMNKKKYVGMKKAYVAINTELLKDIPALIKDRQVFLAPLFATLLHSEINYYSAAANILNGIAPMIRHVDRGASHTHPKVITPDESSTYKMEINLTGPVDDSSSDEEDASGEAHHEAKAPAAAAKPAATPKPAGATPKPGGAVPPPRPAAKAATKRARALYPFTGQDSTELSFAYGDEIVLLKSNPAEEWWEGELNGRRGLLPSNYVELI